jgi:hypothetical protein
VWISALDNRTREPHYLMNRVKVPLNKPFNVGGENIMFAGAPKTVEGRQTSGGNVINCRCSIAQVVRRDSNGNIMLSGAKRPVSSGFVKPVIDNTPPIIDVVAPNVFRAAKSLKEAEERMLKFAPKVNFEGLKLTEQNEILQAIEEILGKYNVKLKRDIGFQIKKSRSLGVAGRDFENNPLYIRIQKTFAKNSLKEQKTTDINFSKSRDYRIRKFQKILSEGTRPQQLLDKTKLNLEILQNTQRWAVYQNGSRPLYKAAVHEAFHTVDYKYGLRDLFAKELTKQNINRNDWYKVSEYGGSTIGELWAETATAVHTGLDIPIEFLKAFNETIKKIPKL